MHASVRRALQTALLTGGLVVAGAAAAHAADDDGLLAGLGVDAPVDVSVDVSGLAAGVLGDATVDQAAAPAATTTPAPATTATTTGGDSDGLASGADVAAPVQVPVDVSAVAVGVLGDASVEQAAAPAATTAEPAAPTATVEQGDSEGAASGAAVAAPVHVPVTVDDVALGLLGDAAVTDTAGTPGTGTTDAPEATVDSGDSDGIASGAGVAAPVSIPVTIGDVSLGLLGDSAVTGGSGTGGTGTDAPSAEVGSGDSDGALAGTGVAAPVSIPVTVGDLALGLVGDATVVGGTGTAGSSDAPDAAVGGGDSDGLLADLGVALPVSVPVTVGDLALGLIGDATVTDATQPGTTDPGTTDPGTTDPGTTDPGTTEPEAVAPVSLVSSEVLAAGGVVTAVEAATTGARSAMVPAALASTGAPAGIPVLLAVGLLALGVLLRRLPRVVLR
ncbi:chaplin family protein [Cellulomonas sp. C5510]|uniref:chaplin family protein n=1 Tax=Cellulomonas sp. C5510 TaxID=2871170 RepID=UPI001C94E465|nr:chaplin family protein [Cellulomonas sp. C5510]QZN85574.1 DUF320 domain-containing protein [Cellulomonas sp. C5510]